MALGSIIAKNDDLDACYGSNHASTWPATLYLHLYGGDPTSGGTELTSAGGYAPAAVANTTSNFAAASGGQKTATITFPSSSGAWSATATYAWFSDAVGCVAPGSLTVGQAGIAGGTAYSYQVTAVNAAGETTASPTGTTTTGNATLSGSNYNTNSWAAVTGAASYNVYKLVSGVFVFLANTASTSYHDTGAATTATGPPATNTTSNLLDGGPLAAPGVTVTAAGAVAQVTVATTSS